MRPLLHVAPWRYEVKPWQGLEKVVWVQFLRFWFGSWMDRLSWVRHCSSFGSWVENGRAAHVSTQSKKEVHKPIREI